MKHCSHLDGYLSLEKVNSTLDLLRGQSLFEGIHKSTHHESFVAARSATSEIDLIKVVLSEKYTFRGGFPKLVPKDFRYIVSFLPQLEQQLNCKDVLHCVDNPKPIKKGEYHSVTSGLYYRCHRIVRLHGNKVLAIRIYCDDR